MESYHWSTYTASSERILALYGKGKALQWDAGRELPWSTPVDPSAPVHTEAFPLLGLPIFRRLSDQQREELTARLMQRAISQFLHGEQGALIVASKCVALCPDYEAKLYAATQTMDEARHVEGFTRYLARCGDVLPIDPGLDRFLKRILGASSWFELLVGMQIVVEGAALASFHAYRQQVRDPLLGALLDGVIRDEARHVGFGNVHLDQYVRTLSPDDRESAADFAFDTVLTFAESRRDQVRGAANAFASVGISLDDIVRDGAEWLKAGNAPTRDITKDGITDFILPALARMGLMTPRIVAKFQTAKLPPAATSSLLAQLDGLVQEQENT